MPSIEVVDLHRCRPAACVPVRMWQDVTGRIRWAISW